MGHKLALVERPMSNIALTLAQLKPIYNTHHLNGTYGSSDLQNIR